MGGKAYAAVLALLALLLVGCVESVPRDPEPPAPTDATPPRAVGLSDPVLVLTDPEGDAREHTSSRAYGTWNQACNLLPAEQPTCREPIPEEGHGGVPAPPALDLVSVEVQEAAEALVFRIGLAALSGDVREFVDETGAYGSDVRIVYRSGTSCAGGVLFEVLPVPDAVFARAAHLRTHDVCEPEPGDPLQGRCATGRRSCWVAVAWSIEPGSPGFVVLTVPRAQTMLLDAETELTLQAFVDRRPGGGMPGGWFRAAGAVGFGQFSYDSRIHRYRLDDTEEATFTLRTVGAPDAWGDPARSFLVAPESGEVADGALDVQTVEIADDPRNLTIALTLRELPEDTERLFFLIDFTTPGKHAYSVTLVAEPGAWRSEATRRLEDRVVPIASEVVLEHGSPGRVVLVVPRAELPATEADGLMRHVFLWGGRGVREYRETAAGWAPVVTWTSQSAFVYLPPYRFATGSAESVELPALEIVDAVGDVSLPTDAPADPSFRAGRYDLTFASLASAPGQRVRLDLGVASLDELVVPRLYDAVVYGAGVQTARGTWMVALVQEKGETPAAICGPDVAFLSESPRAPTLAAGVPVAHTLIPASGDAAGVLSFDLPATCFGVEGEVRDLTVTRMVARTAVVGAPVSAAGASPVRFLDDAEHGEGARLVFPLAAAPARSPWAEPFGVPNFWDILGVALAVLVAFVTVALFLARRVRMKRYLLAVERVASRHHDDPRRCAAELVALRQRVFDDLLGNRITDSHFVMIEERLRGHLSSTRINAFGEAFYLLPPAFMIRLQSLLADGRFSAQDHRALTAFLGRLDIGDASRARVLAELDQWAEQDRAVLEMTERAYARRAWRRLFGRKEGPA